MGSGKTMTMSYLADELRQTSKSQIPQPKVITHYCQDSKSGHQTFVLSALIFSLLKQLPGLKKGFCQWYLESERTGGPYPASDNRRLRAFLQETLENVDRPLYIVVDGMDECDPRSQGDLLEWFVRVSQTCSRVSILLSARPEQQIHRKLEGTGSMDLKPDIERDSELAKHLVNQNLSDLPEDTRSLMVEGIRRSAGGSAIWLRMIIELVQIRQVHEASLIRRLLTQVSLPRRLSDLYETIVENMTKGDPENYRDIFTALRFLAIARRPLSILELAWAVAMAASPAQVVSVEALSAEVDPQRVIHLIHPFIAMIEFDDVRKRQVKLAHQSVMEFLRARDSSDERTAAGPTFNISQHGSVHHQADRMHDLALDICIRYLSLAEIGQRELFTSTQIAIDELPQATDLFGDPAGPVEYDGKCTWEEWEEDMIRYDPTERGFGDLFVYASCYWLEHLTLSKSPYDLANVEELCRAGSLRMSNWMQQHCRPDCVMKPRFEFDSTLYDPLGIVALYGPDPMFRTMLSQLRLDSDLYLEDTVLAAADQILQWGEPDRLVQMFHDDRLGFQLQTPTFIYMVAERWSDSRFRSRNWEPIFDLLSTDEKARELWEGVESTRCGEFVQRLFYRLISDEDQ
ncbi:hypothetical protein BDZ85DRAFT_10798 [Elsinoe ampelina]|uniref:Nephrocystin 3-like N-terminal domain-containing protein n=1 Tax=Elsinoe ampelina TaxID=302913 RepID=A0A6A6GRM4_9PEZI|nr:hypothetical protein BDZ85DRAFT_10798 [Elsinoe ampelina]